MNTLRGPSVLMLLAASAVASPLLAQDTVTVGVGGELSALLYQKFDVPIFVDLRQAGSEKLGSYTIRASWDPNVLAWNGSNQGNFGPPVVRQDSTSYGVIWASGISAAGLAGVVDILELHLNPITSASDTIRVQVTELSAAGTLRNLLATAALVVKSGAYCLARGRWGDLDNDELANSRDALAILSNLVGLPLDGSFDLSLGDVDGDAKVNSRDALILLSYAVGLPIPGQRVLLVAGGACAAGRVPQVTILPDTADLVVGQSVDVVGIALDGSGVPVTVIGGSLSSADPRIAAVNEGKITGREPGVTTVTGSLAPGVQVNIPVIVRAKRGTWFVNAQKATRASVQLGTPKWPFATPQYAFPLVSEGDTIRVAPGNVDYEVDTCYGECYYYTPEIHAGIVIIGDTLPDGTRPVLRASERDGLTALPWYGGLHGEVRNLVLRGFYQPVYVRGLKSLLVDNVRIEEPQTRYGYGIYASGFVDTLRVRRSELMADTSGYQSYDGLRIVSGAKYVEVLDSKFWYWGGEYYGGGGIHGDNIDSLDVFRSEFNYGDYAGIYVDDYSGHTLKARISQNRFIDNYYEAVRVYDAGRVALDHNYIFERDDDAIQIYGPSVAGTKVTMLGDSIKFRADDWDWLDVEDMDSLLVDSLWLENPADTAIYQYGYVYTNYARLTNSKLLNLYYDPFNYYGRELYVNNTQWTGCAVCNWTDSYGIQARAGNDSGPKVTLTNSSFFNMYSVLDMYGSGNGEGPVLVQGNTIDSVSYGPSVNADSVLVTDNLIHNVQTRALWLQPSRTGGRPFVTARVLRNQVSCLGGGSRYGIEVDYGPAQIDSNTVTGCVYGIYGVNNSYPLTTFRVTGNTVQPAATAYYHVGIRPDGRWQPTIVGNRITGGYVGIDVTTTDPTVTAVIDSNAVSGTGSAGIQLYYVNGPVTGRKNNVANNLTYGIYNTGTGTRSFTLGRLVGNALYAIYNASGTTVGAQQNWWGDAAGPGGGVADSVYGSVDAGSPLGSDPGDVPALAPRPVIAMGAAAFRSDVTSVAAPPLAPPTADGSLRPSPRPDRRAQQEARRTAKDSERAARRPAAAPGRDRSPRGATWQRPH